MQVSKISDSRVASAVFRTLRRVALGLALPLLAAACEPYSEINTKFWDSLDRAPFIQLPLSDAWISHPDVSLVLERHHGSVTEQRLLLPNRTSIRGDNFMLMVAREGPLSRIGRFRPAVMVERNGGPPEPFLDFDGQPMSSLEDDFGWLHWSQWTNGTDLTCVLAFRRLDANDRIMPFKTSSIDMMLRNCMRGTAEEALAPISDLYTGYAAIADTPSGNQRMLSPLAGPLP
jgi:hypothetical protein